MLTNVIGRHVFNRGLRTLVTTFFDFAQWGAEMSNERHAPAPYHLLLAPAASQMLDFILAALLFPAQITGSTAVALSE